MKLQAAPIRFLVTRLARAYGFLDPIALLGRLRRFSQPSEVGEPLELLRAGLLFHARGLLNTKAIQHNLDWVWPYWVERQFNPRDASFIPRAFSFSHVNLTHRNWTAVGLPDVSFYPVVDPRGLVTPLFDGWSLDFWFVPREGALMLPSKLPRFDQALAIHPGLAVRSLAEMRGVRLGTETDLVVDGGTACCRVRLTLRSDLDGWVAVALRPYNPEGVSFVGEVAVSPHDAGWRVNDRHDVGFDRPPARHLLSTYADGDVSLRLGEPGAARAVSCPAGMATAAALYPAAEVTARPLEIRVPIHDETRPRQEPPAVRALSWSEARHGIAGLRFPLETYQRLYDQALAGVILHSPGEVYPGPYTYKRFWFRDSVFILHTLLTLGGVARVRRAMDGFTGRQRRDGYFLSQEGEWDSNGEVLWLYGRFARLTGGPVPAAWLEAARKGARWIRRKRLPSTPPRPEAGLLPAGFSAEHLGPNDFYYWDDFWAIAGLREAAMLSGAEGGEWQREADDLMACLLRSLPDGPYRRFPGAIPASPYRRMDAGAIGSIVADYPLQLFPPGDARILRTADFLHAHCFCRGVFLQQMIHSGLNIYLTLHLAQVWLRAGRPALVWRLLQRVAELASPTGQWPEAIHPRTGGGCMGDGEHIWAAAEWLMLLRNLCLREEPDRLVVGAGIRRDWLEAGDVRLEPTLTPHGSVAVQFTLEPAGVRVLLTADWRGPSPALDLHVPGCRALRVPPGEARSDYLLPHAA